MLLGRAPWAFLLASCSGTLGCSFPVEQEVVGVDYSADTFASGYCRTTTCRVPPQYPLAGRCQPLDWSSSEDCTSQKVSNAPVWWRNACIGYATNAAASNGISHDAFATAAARAFQTWASTDCAKGDGSSGPVSVTAVDLGSIACDAARYDPSGPNQNVIVFRDDVWPHADKKNTVALTTLTFDTRTGEIYDADIELNSANQHFSTRDHGESGAYDVQAVLTHEAGHFLGLAHSPLETSVMYESGETGDASRKRMLTAVDVAGICAAYPPGGVRAVSSLVEASKRIAATACDPTPRNGFGATCRE